MAQGTFEGVAAPIRFQNLIHGDGGPRSEAHSVITSQADWDEFFDGHPPQPNPPAGFIVAIGAGQCPTGGYRVEVVSVDVMTIGIMGGTVTVYFRVVPPIGPAIQILTFPFVVTKVELQWAARVVFRQIDERAAIKPGLYIVIQKIEGGGCQVIPENSVYPMTYRQAFGPASHAQCDAWAAANCGVGPDLGG